MKDPHTHDDGLARWASDVLRQLPTRPAPVALAPRVLAAVARLQSRPWYRQPWRLWPLALQVLSTVLVAGALAALWWFLLPRADAVGTSAAQLAASQWEMARPVTARADLLGALFKAVLLVLRGLNTWVIAAALGALALAWSTTLGLGTACWRMAAGTGSPEDL